MLPFFILIMLVLEFNCWNVLIRNILIRSAYSNAKERVTFHFHHFRWTPQDRRIRVVYCIHSSTYLGQNITHFLIIVLSNKPWCKRHRHYYSVCTPTFCVHQSDKVLWNNTTSTAHINFCLSLCFVGWTRL